MVGNMNKTTTDLLIIILSTLIITFLIWLPHFLKLENFYGLNFSEGINTIYRNYDGLEYVVIAKTWYNPNLDRKSTRLNSSHSAKSRMPSSA